MRAAIYARKSTDDSDRDEENRSTKRQVDNARAYAKKNGWTVAQEHIYIDDGISGAEFINRPGLLRMMNDVKDYDAIVMSELSRLGRDQVQNGYYLAQIQSAGVAVHLYLTDEEMKFDSATDRFMASVLSFGAELEREKGGQRTRDALLRKAQAGYSTGGRCYGYNNVPVMLINVSGEKVKSHTDFKVNEAQAEVVRNIFRMYADGYGSCSIAKTLNGGKRYEKQLRKYFGGVAPPAPARGEWCPTCVRPMLRRRRYTGVIEYGRRKNVRANGRAYKRVKQAEFEQTERKDLRIIDPALWGKVQERISGMRSDYIRDNKGRLWGRPDQGRASKYLLSGLGRCEACDGRIVVVGPSSKYLYYGCSRRINRGSCDNNHLERMEWIDTAFLNAVEQAVLTPEALEHVVTRAVAIAKERSAQRPGEVPGLEKELRRERRKLRRFVDCIADGDAPKTIKTEIKQCEHRIEELERTIASYPEARTLSELDMHRILKQAREVAPRFQEVLRRDPPAARQVLRKLLRDERDNFVPVLFAPIMRAGRKSYNLSGQLAVGKIFNTSGVAVSAPLRSQRCKPDFRFGDQAPI